MKKSLIALAALAAVSAASAQSSVTLYGVVDIGYGSQTTEGRATATGTAKQSSSGVMDGANAGNRIGFRGTEDLGGGLKANFVVEQGISPTSGSLFAQRAGSGGQQLPGAAGVAYGGGLVAPVAGGIPATSAYTASTNRQSYVGFSGGFGTVNVGYQYTNLYELATLSGYNIGSEGVAGAYVSHLHGLATVGGTRANGITYISPNMGGFTVRVQYGSSGALPLTNVATTVANVTTETSARRWGLMGQYANGPLSAALAYTSLRSNDLPAVNPNRTANLTQLGASYDFGVVKLAGTYNNGKNGGTAASTVNSRYRAYQLGLSVPLGAFVPYVTIGRASVTPDGAVRSMDVNQAQVGVRYSLSKRTTAYAMYGRVTDNAANVAGTDVYKDKKTLVGVQHSF
ncbi:MAG: porin [Pseudomonadota bacterium]